MDDLISRQAAIDALGEKPLAWTESEYWDPFPSSSSAPEYHQCKRFGGVMMGSRADDYCSYAERREVSE